MYCVEPSVHVQSEESPIMRQSYPLKNPLACKNTLFSLDQGSRIMDQGRGQSAIREEPNHTPALPPEKSFCYYTLLWFYIGSRIKDQGSKCNHAPVLPPQKSFSIYTLLYFHIGSYWSARDKGQSCAIPTP